MGILHRVPAWYLELWSETFDSRQAVISGRANRQCVFLVALQRHSYLSSMASYSMVHVAIQSGLLVGSLCDGLGRIFWDWPGIFLDSSLLHGDVYSVCRYPFANWSSKSLAVSRVRYFGAWFALMVLA